MVRRNKNKLVVPEARNALDQLKIQFLKQDGTIHEGTTPREVTFEVAKEVGVSLSKEYNGNLTTKDAGRIGGQIGGKMVRELVRIAQEELVRKDRGPD